MDNIRRLKGKVNRPVNGYVQLVGSGYLFAGVIKLPPPLVGCDVDCESIRGWVLSKLMDCREGGDGDAGQQ